jgi:phosphoribosylglycinamide formyltransferase 1
MLDAGLTVDLVIVDRACGAAGLAESAGVTVEFIERESFGPSFDRDAYTHRLVDALKRHQIEVVAMAGFGTILSEYIFSVYPGRILNTHPALLPAFPGWHAVNDALAAGVTVTGCTVHIATLETDAGPVLAREEVPVVAGDTVETLHERIKQVERRLYPATVKAMIEELEGAVAGAADREARR